jgi:hypothetical protein
MERDVTCVADHCPVKDLPLDEPTENSRFKHPQLWSLKGTRNGDRDHHHAHVFSKSSVNGERPQSRAKMMKRPVSPTAHQRSIRATKDLQQSEIVQKGWVSEL